MSPVCYRMTAAGRLIPSSPRLLNWGIISNGVCLTANISESRSSEGGCSLSDIVMEDVPDKYYMAQGYLDTLKRHRARNHKKGNGFGYCVVNGFFQKALDFSF